MKNYQRILTYISLIIHFIYLLLTSFQSVKTKTKTQPFMPIIIAALLFIIGNLFLLFKQFNFPLFLVIQLIPLFALKYYYVYFLMITGNFSMTSGV